MHAGLRPLSSSREDRGPTALGPHLQHLGSAVVNVAVASALELHAAEGRGPRRGSTSISSISSIDTFPQQHTEQPPAVLAAGTGRGAAAPKKKSASQVLKFSTRRSSASARTESPDRRGGGASSSLGGTKTAVLCRLQSAEPEEDLLRGREKHKVAVRLSLSR